MIMSECIHVRVYVGLYERVFQFSVFLYMCLGACGCVWVRGVLLFPEWSQCQCSALHRSFASHFHANKSWIGQNLSLFYFFKFLFVAERKREGTSLNLFFFFFQRRADFSLCLSYLKTLLLTFYPPHFCRNALTQCAFSSRVQRTTTITQALESSPCIARIHIPRKEKIFLLQHSELSLVKWRGREFIVQRVSNGFLYFRIRYEWGLW